MSEGSIRVVLFDIGNVIVRATHEITHAILRDLGVPYATAMRFYMNDDYPNFSRGRISGIEFGRRTQERMGGTLTIKQLHRAHDLHLYDVDRETIAVLAMLQSRSVPIAFATDVNEWQTARERELIDLDTGNRTFRSNELGALKVDGGVFERILAELGEEPARVLFVDDSREEVERAAALGMQTHRFTSAAALQQELVRLKLIDG